MKKIEIFIKINIKRFLFWFFQIVLRCIPLKRKVVASNFLGRRYGDNSKSVVEALHELDESIEIVWMQNHYFSYEVPDFVRVVERQNGFRRYFEYATAKVWLDTHYPPLDTMKRRKQLFVETWHGGMSIKRIANANKVFQSENKKNPITEYLVRNASVFISNSDHIDRVYREEFGYKGPIYKCGYPRSDILFCDNKDIRNRVCDYYKIDRQKKIMLYVPTFRDFDMDNEGLERYKYLYGIDFDRLNKELGKRFGGEWITLVRLHPNFFNNKVVACDGKNVIDTTNYNDVMELIMACDACISDYSSAIFDAAMRNIPCFTFARDFAEYDEKRGVEFTMEELPFPYAVDNDELMARVSSFDYNDYASRWEDFKKLTGLHETGHASYDVAKMIKDHLDGNNQIEDVLKCRL